MKSKNANSLFESRTQNLELELSLAKDGYNCIAGVDEVGRGCLAGPVLAAAVIMPLDKDMLLPNVKDSKKLSAKARETLFDRIQDTAIGIGIGRIEPREIDLLNIVQASLKAMAIAIESLAKYEPKLCLIDGNLRVPTLFPQRCVVKGDDRVYSISAASIIAKVTRDRMMVDYAEEYPQYGFEKHKGYGTKLHKAALEKNGHCPLHRQSFLK